MLTIYGCLRSRASRNVWLADEIGLPFRHVPVIQSLAAKPPRRCAGAGIAAAAVAALEAPFAVLDQALAATGFAVGGRFTVADIDLSEVVRHAMPAPALFAAMPRPNAWLAACHAARPPGDDAPAGAGAGLKLKCRRRSGSPAPPAPAAGHSG